MYSGTLLASLAASGVALLARGAGRSDRARRAGAIASASAWTLLSASLAVHVRWGHTPGTTSALPALAFLREHVSFAVAALLPALAMLLPTRKPSQPLS